LRHTGVLDGEVLGGADVLIDLLEQSDRDGQAQMMVDLDVNNPELSRQVRSRLVSVESLAYLSDGLLLEIFLSLEPQTMVVFLAGVREHIRSMILNKAPDEVAADWSSSAANVRGIDPETFRLAEMQVIGKVRGFAANGMLSLFEINEIMFPIQKSRKDGSSRTEPVNRVPVSNLVVA
jgi:flagellar motor switch protein FliG